MFAKRVWAAAWAASALVVSVCDAAPAADPTPQQWKEARSVAAELAQELAQRCPLTAPGDQGAFDACKQGLFGESTLRDKLGAIVLWGRQRDVNATIANTPLTQFAPDVLTGMYLPLFMFNGRHSIDYVEREGLFQIRLATAFRNRLAPGQFPYPFWHDAQKWSTYQGANEVLLWWDPAQSKIKVAQFTMFGLQPPLAAVQPVAPPSFDGRWMWADEAGHSQPKVTLFDGLYRPENPYLGRLDTAYKQLALRLRQGQCDHCHVPNNPDKSKRLVLLQTPAHAAAEIQRLLKAVREDRMPRDETGIEDPLDERTKRALLEDGEAFARVVEQARRWESQARDARLAKGTY